MGGARIAGESIAIAADELAQAHHVTWQWVRGHNKHPQNEYADHLATRAARDQSASDGPVPSLYEEWLAAQHAKGRLVAAAPNK